MVNEDTLCPMTILDHLGVFRGILEVVLPGFATLGLLIVVLLTLPYVRAPLLPLIRLHAHAFRQWYCQYRYRYIFALYPALFARGILHPKLFS